MPPQPSDALPQLKRSEAQVFGTHTPETHLFAPPTPQTSVPVHVPHMRMFPHPSDIEPHCASCDAQVMGLHSHLLGVPLAAQVKGAVHRPQSRLPPHPSP